MCTICSPQTLVFISPIVSGSRWKEGLYAQPFAFLFLPELFFDEKGAESGLMLGSKHGSRESREREGREIRVTVGKLQGGEYVAYLELDTLKALLELLPRW